MIDFLELYGDNKKIQDELEKIDTQNLIYNSDYKLISRKNYAISWLVKYKILHKDFFDFEYASKIIINHINNQNINKFEDSYLNNFFLESIRKKLKISNECLLIDNQSIKQYLFENLIEEGYVFHGTNAASCESIEKNGLSIPTTLKETHLDIKKINEIILSKYNFLGFFQPFHYYFTDSSNNYSSWTLDLDLALVYSADSPEWLSRFLAMSWFFGSDPGKKFNKNHNPDVVIEKDLSKILSNINLLCKTLKISKIESKIIRSFVQKNWKKFYGEEGKSALILVKIKKLKKNSEINKKFKEINDNSEFLNVYHRGYFDEKFNRKILPLDLEIIKI